MSDGTPIPIRRPDQEPRWLIWSLRFAAYAIPLGFLLYVLYWNFLPFGYEKTFTIDVGSPGDTSGEFHLEPSRDLSERKTAPDGTTYRELNGIAYAVFKPKAVLKNAQITVSVEGEGVSIIPPVIDFDPSSVAWDYSWDFTGGEQSNVLQNVGMMATSGPQELGGNAYPFDGCMYFDGKSRLELPDSADMFEEGPFTVYAEWKPEDSENGAQQIIGHYNWELLQNKDNVSFQIGRTNIADTWYRIRYSITKSFFNQKHSVLAIYNPSEKNGYIELYVDGDFAGRTYIGADTIRKDFGVLGLGFGNYGNSNNPYFSGYVCNANLVTRNIIQEQNKIQFVAKEDNTMGIYIFSDATEMVTQIKLDVLKK